MRRSDLDYLARINRAIDHVVRNLDRPLPLEELAAVACFSPFHFHRVFTTVVGETVARFVKRLRLERALRLLSHPPRRSLTEVALACGFASSSDFSRSFKRHFGVPPSAFDVETFRRERRAELQRAVAEPAERHRLDRLPAGENPDGFEVALRTLPPRTVVYRRVPDSYRDGAVLQAATRLVAWAEARGLADGDWLGYMWDDPEIVALERCRYDVGLVVPDGFRMEADGAESVNGPDGTDGPDGADGPTGCIGFPRMQVAEVEIRGPIELEMRALDWLFRTWLPGSGYAPDDQPCFEAWLGRPFAHGTERFELRAQLPVVPL